MTDATAVAFLTAAAILFIGFLGETVFRRTGFPSILLLILVGVALGPLFHFFSPADLAPVTPYLITLALIMITAVASVSTARRRPRETRAPVPHSEE